MAQQQYVGNQIGDRGEEVYELQLRKVVETEENIGKLIAIDIETGDYEIGTDILETAHMLKVRHPEATTWLKRIGYNAVVGVGGRPMRIHRNPA